MNIVIFETEEWEREMFEDLNADHDVRFFPDRLTKENAGTYADADVVSTFIYSDLDRPVLEQMSNLKMIATRSTGFDHIDLDYTQEHDIVIANVPEYGECTVAEHVFALLLAISHKIVQAVDRTRRGDFSPQGLQGFDLIGKTLGVVGTGSIGRCVVRIARGFGMDVIAFDVKPDQELAQSERFRYTDMDDLLALSDVITLHVPASPKTHHLISREEFEKMKDGTVLINTSRGTVVDVQALVRALSEGKVAAAGLDVLPEEPTIREEAELLRSVFRKGYDLETLLADHILLRLRNVVITPHSAFNTREAVERLLATTMDNITAFARGEPQNIVGQ